jgi:hypothetical protein
MGQVPRHGLSGMAQVNQVVLFYKKVKTIPF